MCGKSLVLGFLLVLTFTVAGFCENYYVDAVNGNDVTGDGNSTSPWQTITFALDQVEGTILDQAVINIAPGTYDSTLGEAFTLMMKSYVSLIGEDRGTTTLDGDSFDSSVIYCYDVTSVIISGLTITGGSGILLTGG